MSSFSINSPRKGQKLLQCEKQVAWQDMGYDPLGKRGHGEERIKMNGRKKLIKIWIGKSSLIGSHLSDTLFVAQEVKETSGVGFSKGDRFVSEAFLHSNTMSLLISHTKVSAFLNGSFFEKA